LEEGDSSEEVTLERIKELFSKASGGKRQSAGVVWKILNRKGGDMYFSLKGFFYVCNPCFEKQNGKII